MSVVVRRIGGPSTAFAVILSLLGLPAPLLAAAVVGVLFAVRVHRVSGRRGKRRISPA